MSRESDIFISFLRSKALKLTNQRRVLLNAFVKTERHLTTEDFYNIVKKTDPDIGQATVFRTLKLMCEAGIAREVDFGDKKLRYEHKYAHEHHDHLVCAKCNKYIEVMHPEIEKLQDKLCGKFNFSPTWHKMEIFGICKKCKKLKKI